MTKCPKCGSLVAVFNEGDGLGWYHRCTSETCDFKQYERVSVPEIQHDDPYEVHKYIRG